jgi:hypothetical protein
MKSWLQKNIKNIIITAFVIPILLVAFVSISHVTSFYGLSNPITWAVYLSIGIEIAALSALAAVSVNMGRFVYLPFFVVTLIQMIGNIFFSFTYIDETGQPFQDWVAMVGGLFEGMGIEKTDLNSHKTIVAFLSGGLLPIISLTFAHMLVKFSEQSPDEQKVLSEEEFKEMVKERRRNSESEKWVPSEEQLEILEKILDSKNKETVEEKIIEEPIVKTQEELDEQEEIFERILHEKEPIVEETVQEDLGSVNISEEITETPQDTEVEKKNNSDELHTEQETRGNEDYKVLNYLSRDAQN